MKAQINILIMSSILILSFSTSAHAGGALTHSGQSLQHSTQAVGHMSAGTVKMAAGIVSVPFEIVSKTGELSDEASDNLWEFANGPLPISDETVSVGPTPAEMFQ